MRRVHPDAAAGRPGLRQRDDHHPRRLPLGAPGRADGRGVIRWSHDTQQRNLHLVTAQARDAVTTFLDTGYVQAKTTEITRADSVPVIDPENAIKVVAQKLRFTEDQQKGILAHFIRGADLSAGGVLHAVTSVAQILPDADTAHDMEAQALDAMHLAARA